MFKGFSQFASLLKNAGEIQGRMQEMEENLKRLKVSGSAGGDMVTVEMNGQKQVLSCHIEESLFASGDREMVEDLVVAACNQALEKIRETATMEMNKFAGGFDVPGLAEALTRFNGSGSS